MSIRASLRLARYLTDAARLRREVSPHELDRFGSVDGGGISYAVDTNVVALYLQPNIMGPRSEHGRGGYGQVFHDDPPESSEALGGVLSRYVFYHLTGNETPLILLPGHDAEVRGIYEMVFRQAGEFLDEVDSQKEELHAILHEISRLQDLERKVEILESRTPALLSCLYFSKNPGVELSRFNQLITDRRIVRLAFALERWSVTSGEGSAMSHDVRQAYGVPRTLQDQIVESSFRIDWERRLRHENPSRSDRRLKPDCAALARLELVNRRLRQHEHGRRLVLITGDEAMFRAGDEYQPISRERRTFSDLYLRHPRAFLATSMVVLSGPGQPDANRSGSTVFVTDWLETLLARYTDDVGVDGARLRDLADSSLALRELSDEITDQDMEEEGLEKLYRAASGSKRNALLLIRRAMRVARIDPDAPDRIQSEWKKHFRLLATDHAGVSSIGRAAVEKALSDVLDRDVDEALDELERLLSQRSERTWTEFNRALVVAGFELLLDGGPADETREHVARKRHAPPVVIESCAWANDFVRRMAGASNVFDMFRSEADGLQTLMDHDSTGYMQSLVFALVFANAEKWHIATLLARRAISIADRAPGDETSDTSTSSPSPVSGREAFYLCSFAVRLGARTESGLREAESLLEDAEAALGREHAGNRCLSVGTARFRAERLALGLERHLLARFGDVSVQPGRALEELFECLARLHGELEDERDAWVREHVRRRVLTNAFMIAALIEADGPLPRHVSDFCERQHCNLTALPSPDDTGEPIPTTRLVSAVADYAKARFAQPNGAGARSWIYRQVAKLQRDIINEDETVIVTCYDRKRFGLLIHRTLSALSSRS